MDCEDSGPKDLDMALICFVMNDNEFPTNLEKRVWRQLNGQVVENERLAKGSNQWGIDLYNELQWLDDKDKQYSFVLLKDYVKPMGTRGPRPTDGKDRLHSSGDENSASRSKQVRSNAQDTSSMSELEGFLSDLSDLTDEDDYDSEREDYDDTNDTYLPPSTRRKILRPATTLPQRESLLLAPSAHAATTASELPSTRDTEKQQQHRQAYSPMARQHGVFKRRSNVSRATASLNPHSVQHAYKEAEQDKATPITAKCLPRKRPTRPLGSPRDDSQGPDEPVVKRSKISSAPAKRSIEKGGNSGAFRLPPAITTGLSWNEQTSRPVQRSYRSGQSNLPLPPVRRPATLASPETATQQLDQLPAKYRSQPEVSSPDYGADKSEFADKFKEHMLRLRSNNGGQRGMTVRQQDHLARAGTHGADFTYTTAAGERIIHDDEQGALTAERHTRAERFDTSEETKPVSEKVLSAHMIHLQVTLDTMEDNLMNNMARAMGDIKAGMTGSGSAVLKPGSKLPNGVVVWDVRLLTTVWNPEDFGDFFSVVEEEHWNEDDRAWMLQEKYFTELALAHPCSPKSLAELASAWQLTDLEVDLEKDLPVVLAQKVYIQTVARTFEEDQMEVFFESINEG